MSLLSDFGEGMNDSFASLPPWFRSLAKIVIWFSIGTLLVATLGEMTYSTIMRALPTTPEAVQAAERKAAYERHTAEAQQAWRVADAKVRAQEEIEAAKVEANRLSLGLSARTPVSTTAALASLAEILTKNITALVAIIVGVVAINGIGAYRSIVEKRARELNIKSVEERLRQHPDRPQLAWDLARVKLESYLDRNLSQVRSIYGLTLSVMFCGFGFVLFGLFQASQTPDKLPVSIVAAASGVLISFIGGSFLLIYRSILAQSKEYVTVLERINAVGMAVQVIASIPETNGELKSHTTSELAKQLLNLYATSPTAPAPIKPGEA